MQALIKLGQVRVRRSTMDLLAIACMIIGLAGFAYMALDAAGVLDSIPNPPSWAGAGWR